MSSHPAIKDLFGIRIDEFLSGLSDEAKRKMWPIVNALRLELELSGSTTFPVPLDKFDRNRCSREDVGAILANLHKQGILSVSVRYKTEYNPDKFSVQTIDQNPQIYDYPLATVSLNKDQFAYLNTKLELFVHPERLAAARSAIKVLSTRSKTGQYCEIGTIIKQVTRDCLAIKDWPSHRSLRDFWLNTRRVLDIICNKLTIGLDGKPKKEIPISLGEFYEKVSLKQKKVIHETLDNLVAKGVVSTRRPDLEDEYISRGDGIFENGKVNLLIILPDYLKELRHRISDLVDFIEADGKKRFPEKYPQPDAPLKNMADASSTPNIKRTDSYQKGNLRSIHLVTESLEPKEVIFLVLDEHYEIPIRCEVNNHEGRPAYIKKLYDLAYPANAPGKSVPYSRNLSDSISNGLFRLRQAAQYMKANNLSKPTLVKKSEDGKSLVLKNEVTIKTALIKNIPPQYQYLYIDKTK